jgi:hypothetical protein
VWNGTKTAEEAMAGSIDNANEILASS